MENAFIINKYRPSEADKQYKKSNNYAIFT